MLQVTYKTIIKTSICNKRIFLDLELLCITLIQNYKEKTTASAYTYTCTCMYF
jgi:hypothetical protein